MGSRLLRLANKPVACDQWQRGCSPQMDAKFLSSDFKPRIRMLNSKFCRKAEPWGRPPTFWTGMLESRMKNMISYRGDKFFCKICNCDAARVVAHTAQCRNCRVLLYWPYPPSDGELIESGQGKSFSTEKSRRWYAQSADRNHNNFTEMVSIGMLGLSRMTEYKVLDFGGGGGQFACVCRSLFPGSQIYITDISDEALLPE